MAYANNYLEMLQPYHNIEKKKRERKRIKNNALAVMMWLVQGINSI